MVETDYMILSFHIHVSEWNHMLETGAKFEV